MQNISHHILALVLLSVAVISLLANLWKIPRATHRSSGDLAAVIYTSASWSACALLENFPLSPSERLFFGNLAWFAIAALPLALSRLLWTVTYGRQRLISIGVRTAAAIFIALTGLIAFTNPGRLMYQEIIPAVDNDGPLRYVHGPLFYVIILVLYISLLSTIGITLWAQRHRARMQRRIHFGIVLSVLAPLVASMAYASGHLLLFSYDPSPFAFLVMAPVLAWLLKRGGLCDPLPVARQTLMESLIDAVVVTDNDHYVLTANIAAFALPGFTRTACEKPLLQTEIWGDVMMRSIDAPGMGIALDSPDDSGRYFDITATRLNDHSKQVGHLLVIKDVTKFRIVEERLRQALTQLTGQLEENVLLQDALRLQAHRDPLTSLYNRRALDHFLPTLARDSDEGNYAVSAVMMDIDHFKSINDTYGHAVGDTVLQQFGFRIMAMLRQRDLAFRMGGEEFLILLWDTAMQDAINIVNRWREAFRTGFDAGEINIVITFSVGVATKKAGAFDPTSLISEADAAAYHSKRNGRDQVSAFTEHGAIRVTT